jgi:hypothetical protein
MSEKQKDGDKNLSQRERRNILNRLNRFTKVSAPSVTLLLAAEAKPMLASVMSPTSCMAALPFGLSKPRFA